MNALALEQKVNEFLAIARSNPRVWAGLVATLRRFPDEGIHGRCVSEAHHAHLTETIWEDSPSELRMSNTRFTNDARKMIAANLNYIAE